MRGRAALAVILGSGLAGAASAGEMLARLPYGGRSGLPLTTVAGHPGRVSLRRVEGAPVLFFAGRFHRYEGFAMESIVSPVSLAAFLGCRRLIVTQAAGSLTPRLGPGTWMLAMDAVAFPSRLELGLERPGADAGVRGLRDDTAPQTVAPDGAPAGRPGGGPLFSSRFASDIRDAARAAGTPLAEGVLCWTSGPVYETAAEARAAALMGADAATMSSYPELVAARREGLDAVSLGFITNHAANVAGGRTDHADVVNAGAAGVHSFLALLAAYLRGADSR